jgi:hypothetical protein
VLFCRFWEWDQIVGCVWCVVECCGECLSFRHNPNLNSPPNSNATCLSPSMLSACPEVHIRTIINPAFVEYLGEGKRGRLVM